MSGTSCSRKYAKHYAAPVEQKTSYSGLIILAVLIVVALIVILPAIVH